MLTEVGFFRSKTRASKRLRRLVEKKHLHITGSVCLKNGRPEYVYCRRSLHVKADNLLHEVQLSRICFRIHADEVRRGPAEVDRYLLPDAELRINGRRFLLEFDAGTMGLDAIITTRFAKYRSCDDLVLWVCATQARMERLRRHAESIRSIALFTTLELVLRAPHAPLWMDFDGERAALPRGAVSLKGDNG